MPWSNPATRHQSAHPPHFCNQIHLVYIRKIITCYIRLIIATFNHLINIHKKNLTIFPCNPPYISVTLPDLQHCYFHSCNRGCYLIFHFILKGYDSLQLWTNHQHTLNSSHRKAAHHLHPQKHPPHSLGAEVAQIMTQPLSQEPQEPVPVTSPRCT